MATMTRPSEQYQAEIDQLVGEIYRCLEAKDALTSQTNALTADISRRQMMLTKAREALTIAQRVEAVLANANPAEVQVAPVERPLAAVAYSARGIKIPTPPVAQAAAPAEAPASPAPPKRRGRPPGKLAASTPRRKRPGEAPSVSANGKRIGRPPGSKSKPAPEPEEAMAAGDDEPNAEQREHYARVEVAKRAAAERLSAASN